MTPTLPVVEQIVNESVQGNMPANDENLSAARRPASLSEEPAVFLTKIEIQAIIKQGRERASTASASLDLKPHYPNKVAAKQLARLQSRFGPILQQGLSRESRQ